MSIDVLVIHTHIHSCVDRCLFVERRACVARDVMDRYRMCAHGWVPAVVGSPRAHAQHTHTHTHTHTLIAGLTFLLAPALAPVVSHADELNLKEQLAALNKQVNECVCVFV